MSTHHNARPMEPFFFRSPSGQLFGCYDRPAYGRSRDCGVVLCQSMGEEYIRFHRAFRRLSDLLVEAGFPVLRFDYYGCGDSSGASEQARISHWCADVAAAISEMQRQPRVTRICLIGLRLGASLAMIAGAEHKDVDRMVLWDPVVRGPDYVKELGATQQRMLQYAHVVPRRDGTSETAHEVLGFPFTDSLRSDLEALDLLAVRQEPADNMLLIESNARTDLGRLEDHIKSMGIAPAVQRFRDPGLWVWDEAVGRVLVPNRVLQSVVSWLSEVSP